MESHDLCRKISTRNEYYAGFSTKKKDIWDWEENFEPDVTFWVVFGVVGLLLLLILMGKFCGQENFKFRANLKFPRMHKSVAGMLLSEYRQVEVQLLAAKQNFSRGWQVNIPTNRFKANSFNLHSFQVPQILHKSSVLPGVSIGVLLQLFLR